MLNNFRKSLINRLITLYGFEHPVVIDFTVLAEVWRGDEQVLRVLVESHEACPLYED